MSAQIDIEEAIARATVSTFLDGKVTLHGGDCLSVMASLPENSIDSIVCDPPYHLTSIVKRFGSETAAPVKAGKTGAYARASAGFMGKVWDGGDIAFRAETWELAYRLLKPGGHMLAFSGTRTYHRMAFAIEDAGFEIRDQIMWVYASGFPKSHSVSKAIDRAAGAEREVMGSRDLKKPNGQKLGQALSDRSAAASGCFGPNSINEYPITAPSTEAAKQWDGWGSALKPAFEPICLARKPLSEPTIAANVLKWGTGALNIDACRIPTGDADALAMARCNSPGSGLLRGRNPLQTSQGAQGRKDETAKPLDTTQGRWPANVMHDNSPEVVAMFPDSDGQQGIVTGNEPTANGFSGAVAFSGMKARVGSAEPRYDSGSAARFFWSSKAAADDRLGSKHPTVKPIDLIQELIRLVTQKGGTVLDMFAGTGTTGEAAWREGMHAILIEREPEYQADIARRMDLATQPTKRSAVAKSKNKLDRPEDLPLFNMEPAE